MSEFLSNLVARSKETLETIRPRVPSRFEPVRKPEGLLAGRTLPGEERLEDNPELEGEGGVEDSSATHSTERRSRRARRADASLLPLNPSPVPTESAPEPTATSPAARTAPRASSPRATTRMVAPTSGQGILQAKRIPGSESAGSSTPAHPNIADAVTPVPQNAGLVSGLEPIEAGTVPPVEPAIVQKRGANEGATQSRSAQQTRPAQPLSPSSANTPHPGLIVSPTIRTPAFSEPRQERPARPASVASSKSEIEPRIPSSQAKDTAPMDEPGPAMPMALELARNAGVFQDGFGNQSGSGSAPALRPDLSIRPAPREEAATFDVSSEHEAGVARPAAANLPAPQALAGAASEPAIRVTIGRVEVRAVFPEQPVKRSAPPRFRPSVTLDDYLNRGSGAKR